MPSTNQDFTTWLMAELAKRGWSREELSRRAGLYPSVISKIVSGGSRMGPETARKIARGLGVPQLTVFRKAGLIDETTTEDVADEDILSLIQRFTKLSSVQRKMVLSMLTPLLSATGESTDVEGT